MLTIARSYFLVAAFGAFIVALSSLASAETPAKEPIIRSIAIEVREIFDESDLGFFYRAVNGLKISTKEEIVRRELLFKEGEPFDRFLVAESERNLRAIPFLRQVSITPVFDGDVVDLIVSVQDTWTLFPFLALSSGGGTSKSAVGLAESNILGYGKRAEVLVADDEGRQKIEGVWDDRRLLGTFQQLTIGHFDRSDGFRSVVSYGRPFRSLTEPYAWASNADIFDLVGRLFDAGDERFVYRQEHVSLAGGVTFAQGDPELALRRYTIGYDYTEDSFSEADAQDFEDIDVDPSSVSRDPTMLADDRRFSGPFFAFQYLEPDFLSINFVDRFDRVQDFNLGREFNVGAHAAADILGSKRDTLLYKISNSDGWRISPTSFARAGAGASFRLDHVGIDDAVLRLEAKYYNILGSKFVGDTYVGKHTLAANFEVDVGENLDRDSEFLLGAGTGLRGYKDRAFSGNQALILNLEDRYHIVEDVFRLVSIGGAFFADAGGTSNNGVGDVLTDRMYYNVGLGLRFALTRSSGGAVVRMDLAFPLRDGPDGSKVGEPRLLFTTGQLFNANLSSESSSANAARVSAGFLP